jgi:hypothetical protein
MTLDDVFTPLEKDRILDMKNLAKSHINLLLSEKILDTVQHYLIVAGGAFPDWYHNTRKGPNDIDVFVLHDEIAKNKLRAYLGSNGFVTKSLDYLKQTNPGATHVQEVWEGIPDGRKYQFIFTDYWTREELIKEFDYKHCMVSYDVGKNQIYITRQIYDAIANKQLIVNNGNRVAEWRRNKFLQRGYTAPVKEVIAVTTLQDLYEQYGKRLASITSAQDGGGGMIATYQRHLDKLLKDLEVNGQ